MTHTYMYRTSSGPTHVQQLLLELMALVVQAFLQLFDAFT